MSQDSPTWFGQPRGLTILFLTEMWEIFSYYGMRALLVYYMTKELLIGQGSSSLIYGAYTASAYFTPIIGGIIADRYLGKRRSVILGASIMTAGHFMMTMPALFFPALATIAIGNGLFLPSLPSQITTLYRPGDPRLARAYNVYYVGINIGGFLAPLICGTLGEIYGWHYGFGAAGIGMLLGLVIYVVGGPRYLPAEEPPSRSTPAAAVRAQHGGHGRLWLLLLGVGLAVTVFRGAYEQMGNTVALWADVGIDRHAASRLIPMTWFQSLNPLLVILMTPALLAHWRRRSAAGRSDAPMPRMALGAFIVALAYLVLAAVSAAAPAGGASWLWLVVFFIVFTLGELHILPTGLGLFARLAPKGLGATTLAAWFLAVFSGSLAAGALGALWTHMSHSIFFGLLAVVAIVSGVFLLALDRPARRIEAAHVVESGAPGGAPHPGVV
jgi:POT family proton-dependent oligopeptide transporter